MANAIVPANLSKAISEPLAQGDTTAAVEAVEAALAADTPPLAIIQEVIIPTLISVGDRFERMEIFLPELMGAGLTGSACSAVLEKALAESGSTLENLGTVVVGTVKGDIHDIGKNILASLLKAHGYLVIDVGKDAPAQAFIEAAEQNKADVIAASALMSITRAGCRDIAGLLQELGFREKYRFIVGGGSIDQAYADEIGADGYASSAVGGVALVDALLA